MAKKKKKLTFAVSKGLATAGVVMALSGCVEREVISNPVPPDCCVNPAIDFGGDTKGDAGDTGSDAGKADAADASDASDASDDAASSDDVGSDADTGSD